MNLENNQLNGIADLENETATPPVKNPLPMLFDIIIFIVISAGYAGAILFFTKNTQNIVIYKPIILQSCSFIAVLFLFIKWGEIKNIKWADSPVNLFMVLFLLWNLMTFLVTPFKYAAVEEFLRFLSYITFFFIIINVFNTKLKLSLFLILIFITASLAIGYGVMQYTGNDFVEWEHHYHISTFGNKHLFFGFLTGMMPLIIFLIIGSIFDIIKQAFKSNSNTLKIFGEIIIIVLAGILLFYLIKNIQKIHNPFFLISTGVILGIFLTAGIISEIIPVGPAKSMRNKKFSIAAGVILAILILVTGLIFVNNHLKKDVPLGQMGIKHNMWKGAYSMFKDKPVTGQGIGSFQLVFPSFRPSYYHRVGVSHNTLHAHNEYLEILSETGVIGLILYLSIICISFFYIIDASRMCKNIIFKYISLGAFAGVLSMSVYAADSIRLRFTAPAVLMWVLLGLSYASLSCCEDKEKSFNHNDKPVFRFLIYILLIILILFHLYWSNRIIKSEKYLKYTMFYTDNIRKKPENADKAEKYALLSIEQNPYNLSAYYKLGYIYLTKSEFKKAMDCYQKLIKIAPNYAQIHNNTGLIYARLGDKEKAIAEFEKATALESSIRNHRNLAMTYKKLGDLEKAKAHFKTVVEIAEFNINRYKDMRRDFLNTHGSQSTENWDRTIAQNEKVRSSVLYEISKIDMVKNNANVNTTKSNQITIESDKMELKIAPDKKNK